VVLQGWLSETLSKLMDQIEMGALGLPNVQRPLKNRESRWPSQEADSCAPQVSVTSSQKASIIKTDLIFY
jgi:hypothetical protein